MLVARLFENCRIVPVEATEEMQDAGYSAVRPIMEEMCEPSPYDHGIAWKAMLAAAPLSPLEKALEDVVKAVRQTADEPLNSSPFVGAYFRMRDALARLDAVRKEMGV